MDGCWICGGQVHITSEPINETICRSTRGRVLHARLQPALGDSKEPCGFARGKGFVKAEHAAVAAVAL